MRGLVAAIAAAGIVGVVIAGPFLLAEDSRTMMGRAELADPLETPLGLQVDGRPLRFVLGREPALDPRSDALLVRGPDVGYEPNEVTAIRNFLHAGGVAAIVGSNAVTEDLLERMGTGLRLVGPPLYTPSFETRPDRFLARNTGVFAELPADVASPRPRAVLGGEAILVAPEPTWADANANGRPDLGEERVFAAVAARAAVGSGWIIVVGYTPEDSREDPIETAVLDRLAADGRTIVVDEAHRIRSDPFLIAPALSGSPPTSWAAAILMMTVGLGLAVALQPRLLRPRRRRASPRDSRYPPELVRELVSELEPE